MTTYEVRSYSHNGADWEWHGDGWPTEAETPEAALESDARDGDWSQIADGKPILLRAFEWSDTTNDTRQLAELEFTPAR